MKQSVKPTLNRAAREIDKPKKRRKIKPPKEDPIKAENAGIYSI